jgi:alpha-L-fucosidase
MHERLRSLFAEDLAAGGSVAGAVRPPPSEKEVDLGRSVPVSMVRLAEDITRGQVVARYRVLGSNGGEWQPLSRGTTIGYAKLDRFAPTTVRRVRVVVDEVVAPAGPIDVKVFAG